MIPSPGRIVEYTLGENDVVTINDQRKGQVGSGTNPKNLGNQVGVGDTYPLVITRVWGASEGSAVNGQVLLDGNDTLWATSRTEGDGEYHWRPFPRV